MNTERQNMDDEMEINLGELFYVIMSKLGIILLVGIIASMAVMIGTMLFVTPQYQSTTKMYVLTKQNSDIRL